ncbi:hypothetical protein BH11MYX2_BH11MYX2_26800 [soil metagenome]
MLRLTPFLLVAACGGNAPVASTPASNALTPVSLVRVGARDTFCAPTPPDADGCVRSCTPAPLAWTGSSIRFPHAELWAQTERCPNAIVTESVVCSLAVEHAGAWFVASKGRADIIDYSVESTLESMDASPDGGRTEHSFDDHVRYITACVGPRIDADGALVSVADSVTCVVVGQRARAMGPGADDAAAGRFANVGSPLVIRLARSARS